MKPIELVRRENLQRLIDEHRPPTQAAFARTIGKDKNQVSQWLGKGQSRNIKSDSAREIERICGKPEGWMDVVHAATHVAEPPAFYGSQAGRLDPANVTITARTLQVVLGRRGTTLDLSNPIHAELFCEVYEEAKAMPADDPAKATVLGAAVMDLLLKMGERDDGRSAGKSASGVGRGGGERQGAAG